MLKKIFAVLVLALIAIFSVPAIASAVGYVPSCSASVTGSAIPGGTVTVSFCDGSFTPGENVSWASTGVGDTSLAVVKAATVTIVKPATAGGASSVDATLPSNASGVYTITATGLTSGNVGSANVALPTPSSGAGGVTSDSGLAATGYALPSGLLWSAGGALLLGTALLVVLLISRRRHANIS